MPSDLCQGFFFSSLLKTGYRQQDIVEIVAADKSAIEETDEKLKPIKTPDRDMKDTACQFNDIQTSDTAINTVLSQNSDLIIAVSFPSTLTDHPSSGLVIDEKPKTADEETF